MSDTATIEKPKTSVVRAWARDNGHTVGTRGTLPTTVVEAFEAANPR